ncbi:MAG: hypothetical protein GC181_04535 [Bacteroidetes bacterium]|nr:hypothetical protein [Bacteroidota bacterium]
MDQNSTINTLLQKIYGELSQNEEVELANLLSIDEVLEDEMNSLLFTVELLDKAYTEPNQTSVQLILEESLKTQLETH